MRKFYEPIFNRTAHRQLWDWLSKHPTMDKRDWPRWKSNGGWYTEQKNFCFSCQYVRHVSADTRYLDCDLCPLIWPNSDKLNFSCDDDLYGFWCDASKNRRYKEARRIAELIRDLPVRPGVKCK